LSFKPLNPKKLKSTLRGIIEFYETQVIESQKKLESLKDTITKAKTFKELKSAKIKELEK